MTKKCDNPDPMTPAQAIGLAILALEWESEEAAQQRGHRNTWAKECREEAEMLKQVRERLTDSGLYES